MLFRVFHLSSPFALSTTKMPVFFGTTHPIHERKRTYKYQSKPFIVNTMLHYNHLCLAEHLTRYFCPVTFEINGPTILTNTFKIWSKYEHWPVILSFLNAKRILTRFPLFGLDLWLDVHEQCVQRQTVREDKVANIVAPDAQGFQLCWLPVFRGHLHSLQVGIHAYIDTCMTTGKWNVPNLL